MEKIKCIKKIHHCQENCMQKENNKTKKEIIFANKK